MRTRGSARVVAAVLAVAAMAIAACSDDPSDTSPATTAPPTTEAVESPTTRGAPPSTSAPPATTAPASTTPATTTPARADDELAAAVEAAVAAGPAGCDPLDTVRCYLPFPSDAYASADPSTATGVRVALPPDGAPANAAGVPIDVAEWNRNDGFSPSSTILTAVADLDAAASGLPSWTDLGASLAPDAPVVVVDLTDGERVPSWAEQASRVTDATETLLVIHPAVSLAEGHTFAVALRGLVTTAGSPVEPGAVFRAYRDALLTDTEPVEARRPAMETMFAGLADAGVARDDLQLAWTFTVATGENITGRATHIRDETLAELGDSAPPFTVTAVTDRREPGLGRFVEGTFTVANWLTRDGTPGNRFAYATDPAVDPDALPERNGTVEAPFACTIGDATLDGTGTAHLVQYGHGLLGSHLEVDAGNIVAMANEHGAVYCATKWAGFSEDDVGNAVASLNDMSNFPTMVDRMQQGFVDQMVLGRLMLAADGLASDPAFSRADGTPMLDTSGLTYDGNSQGGIMGMALAALSPDIHRAVLGVVGMNYSLLLPRSVDFTDYEAVFIPAYPDPLDRMLVLSLIQMVWDRGEGAGYVQHLAADPLKDAPTDVLMHVAFGDWQVSELSAFVAARTAGIPVHRPVTADDRSREVQPGWGLNDAVPGESRSALVIWDSGSAPIPVGDRPPSRTRDPHADPRNDPDVRTQKAAFLFDGELVDVCAGAPCRADAS